MVAWGGRAGHLERDARADEAGGAEGQPGELRPLHLDRRHLRILGLGLHLPLQDHMVPPGVVLAQELPGGGDAAGRGLIRPSQPRRAPDQDHETNVIKREAQKETKKSTTEPAARKPGGCAI